MVGNGLKQQKQSVAEGGKRRMRSDSFTVQNTNSLKPLKTVSDWLLMGANMPTGRGSDAAIKRTFGRSFKFFFLLLDIFTDSTAVSDTYIHTHLHIAGD